MIEHNETCLNFHKDGGLPSLAMNKKKKNPNVIILPMGWIGARSNCALGDIIQMIGESEFLS